MLCLLWLATGLSCVPAAHAATDTMARPARHVAPATHALQRQPRKSAAAEVAKPAFAPRRHGPVLKLDAALEANGKLELRCDEDHSVVAPTAPGDRP